MLLLKKLNHVSVIRTYNMIFKAKFLVLYLYYACSYKLITRKKRFNAKANICQHKNEFYLQILILLKPYLLDLYFRSDALAIL